MLLLSLSISLEYLSKLISKGSSEATFNGIPAAKPSEPNVILSWILGCSKA